MREVEIPAGTPHEISVMGGAVGGGVLGRDPFEEPVGADPFVDRLDELEGRMPDLPLARTTRDERRPQEPFQPEQFEQEQQREQLPQEQLPQEQLSQEQLSQEQLSQEQLSQEQQHQDPPQETHPPEPRRGRQPMRVRESRSPSAPPPPRGEPSRKRVEAIARLTHRHWTTTPLLSEIETPDPQGVIDRLISADMRKRLAALTHLVETDAREEALYDRFGFSPTALKNSFPLFHALYRFYFRVHSEGHANVPAEGPVVLAGNHGGLLPFDGAMTIVDLILNTDPPRLARTIVDRWAGSLPFVNIFYARVGQVIGTRENFASLLDDGQVVLVFPEGIEGIRKTIAHRFRLQQFRVGFIENALRARATIVPMAIIGSDNQSPILYDIKPLARALGLPVAPITPTFPLLGPLGLLPYPVKYKIVYGEPLRYHERFGPEGAEDSRLVKYLANQVRRSVQLLVDRNR